MAYKAWHEWMGGSIWLSAERLVGSRPRSLPGRGRFISVWLPLTSDCLTTPKVCRRLQDLQPVWGWGDRQKGRASEQTTECTKEQTDERTNFSLIRPFSYGTNRVMDFTKIMEKLDNDHFCVICKSTNQSRKLIFYTCTCMLADWMFFILLLDNSFIF